VKSLIVILLALFLFCYSWLLSSLQPPAEYIRDISTFLVPIDIIICLILAFFLGGIVFESITKARMYKDRELHLEYQTSLGKMLDYFNNYFGKEKRDV